jgi:RNA polymerase sigma factor (sigma-70 family)
LKTSTPDLESLTDNALMARVKEGDLDRLGLLFERYKKPLFGFFFGMHKDRDLSEDLVQNVFVRILKYRTLFRGDGEFRTWMFHIARNVSHDHFRKKKIDARDTIEDWEDRLGSDENRMTQYQQEENELLLSMAMDKLPDDKREILLLSKYQEKKYKEIAEILDCTEASVKVKVFRALQELKEIFRAIESQR